MKNHPDHIDTANEEFQNALQIVCSTHRSLFLTGKAGSGKSTFLRYVCEHVKKKKVVLAPTGIAAINAGGVTLHSFFKLPFHPLLPDDRRFSVRKLRETMKYTAEKQKIIRELELIIIDEISMVRADIIDFIDKVLRVYSRNMREPFGGKQLLLVGDVFQLEPVLREDERRLLAPYYPSSYFFDAHVFREMKPVSVELLKTYRQSDAGFIGMLDNIRENHLLDSDLQTLNSRVGAPLDDGTGSLSITLATRRDTADHINDRQLRSLEGQPLVFYGEVEGEFPLSNLPTLMELQLKVGAQVIFVKNDMDRRWVNGTLGVITAIDCLSEGATITIRTEEGEEHDVGREKWSNMRYTYNEEEKKIEEQEIGTFVQFPIRLAWAITIHKCQGLTFKRAVIDFTGGVFAAGQAYVALSRCTSLEGLSMNMPLRRRDVFLNEAVVRFARNYNDKTLYEQAIRESAADRAYRQAVEAYDEGRTDDFLDHFFKAIHGRYDIEKPVVRRFIRRRLERTNALRAENRRLQAELKKNRQFLQKLSVEYTMLGKECEDEHMIEAAISNYRKALELSPDNSKAQRSLKRLLKSKDKPLK